VKPILLISHERKVKKSDNEKNRYEKKHWQQELEIRTICDKEGKKEK
jgi:hypothetical protein